MSTAGNSYEAWKESLKQAEAEGYEVWSEELSEASGPVLRRLGALEGNGLATLLAGVGLLIASAVVLLPNGRHLALGERTVGIVVSHKTYGLGSSEGMPVPVVRYSAPGGVYEVSGFLPASYRIYPIGDEVSVLYLRNNPRNGVIFDFVQMFLIPTFVGGLGLVCLVGTAVLQFSTIRGEVQTSTSVVTRLRQFAVADGPLTANDAANSDDTNSEDANCDPANNDDREDLSPQREHHAVAQG